MTIPELDPFEPFRRLHLTDLGKPYGSSDRLMNRIKLKDYYEYSIPLDQDTIVYEGNGEIIATVTIKLMKFEEIRREQRDNGVLIPDNVGLNSQDRCVYIEYINKNSKSLTAVKGDGALTLRRAILHSKKLEAKAVFLEADGETPIELAAHFYVPEGFLSVSKLHYDRIWEGDVILMVSKIV